MQKTNNEESDTVVSLPSLPTGTEYEEYVAASLQADGFYIERQIVDRGIKGILELDIITTDYPEESRPNERLLEVKSGKNWGFGDIFKLVGWGQYLNISTIELVVCERNDQHAFYENKAQEIGVTLRHHPNDDRHAHTSQLPGARALDPADSCAWRLSYWLERVLLQELTHRKRCSQDVLRYRSLCDYIDTINNGVFLTRNIVERANKLYDAYRLHPNISARTGREIDGDDFLSDHDSLPTKVYEDTFYNKEFTDVCFSTYIEYRARLSLLKAAVDFALYETYGITENKRAEIENTGFNCSLDTLPRTFIDGLATIRTHKFFHRYPVFWQNFLWLFGGFILEDYRQREYQLLSDKTGIPTDEIDTALTAFDLLFPTPNGWFTPGSGNSTISYLKMFSTPFVGIGVNYRRLVYTNDKNLDSLMVTGTYTKDNLTKWNNLLGQVLNRDSLR